MQYPVTYETNWGDLGSADLPIEWQWEVAALAARSCGVINAIDYTMSLLQPRLGASTATTTSNDTTLRLAPLGDGPLA